MISRRVARTSGAIVIVAALVGVNAAGVAAQDDVESTVIVGEGASAVEVGDVVVLAPGVTISGGEVSNETGIGVIIGGGSSIGSSPGGGTNTSVPE